MDLIDGPSSEVGCQRTQSNPFQACNLNSTPSRLVVAIMFCALIGAALAVTSLIFILIVHGSGSTEHSSPGQEGLSGQSNPSSSVHEHGTSTGKEFIHPTHAEVGLQSTGNQTIPETIIDSSNVIHNFTGDFSTVTNGDSERFATLIDLSSTSELPMENVTEFSVSSSILSSSEVPASERKDFDQFPKTRFVGKSKQNLNSLTDLLKLSPQHLANMNNQSTEVSGDPVTSPGNGETGDLIISPGDSDNNTNSHDGFVAQEQPVFPSDSDATNAENTSSTFLPDDSSSRSVTELPATSSSDFDRNTQSSDHQSRTQGLEDKIDAIEDTTNVQMTSSDETDILTSTSTNSTGHNHTTTPVIHLILGDGLSSKLISKNKSDNTANGRKKEKKPVSN